MTNSNTFEMQLQAATKYQDPSKLLTTYSMWNAFRNCRKLCEFRYVDEIVPVQTEQVLQFGTLVHKCLEMWHSDKFTNADIYVHINRSCNERGTDDQQRADWHLATAMMKAYFNFDQSEEPLKCVAIEQQFTAPIINPATGQPSRSFYVGGKIDALVRNVNGEYWLMENKTAAGIDADYLEKLWTDLQITMYVAYLEAAMGIRIVGIIYNVLVKKKLKQSAGETEEEFQERYAVLCAANKSGKSTATRKMPETDEAYAARLDAAYAAEPDLMHREVLYLSRDQIEAMKLDVWEFTQQFLSAKRKSTGFYRNTSYCFNYHRPCAYYSICRAANPENVIENFYEHKAAHSELAEEATEEPMTMEAF